MQQLTVTLNLKRGLCRISTPLYLGGEYAVSYTPKGAYSLVMTEPFADSPKDGIVVWAQTDSGNTLRLTRKALHNAFVRSDSRQPGMTLSAKVFVLDESGATVADGTATVEFSPAQYIIDDAEYPTAREVLFQAQNAVSEAKRSVQMAQTAQSGAESAKTAAEKAKSAAEDAKYAAKSAAATSSAARKDAITAKDAAQNAQKAAEKNASTAETALGKMIASAKEVVGGVEVLLWNGQGNKPMPIFIPHGIDGVTGYVKCDEDGKYYCLKCKKVDGEKVLVLEQVGVDNVATERYVRSVNGTAPNAAGNVKIPLDFLPLTGGTLTGALTMSKGGIKKSEKIDALDICSGTSYEDSPALSLYPTDYEADSAMAGHFVLRVGDNLYRLIGKPDGTLLWDGKAVQLSGTIKTSENKALAKTDTKGGVQICGGTSLTDGGAILGYGKDYESNAEFKGALRLQATDGTKTYDVVLFPDGRMRLGNNTQLNFQDNEDQRLFIDEHGDMMIGDTNGALLRVRGQKSEDNSGGFQFRAKDADGNTVYLIGKPDGTLTWDGSQTLLPAGAVFAFAANTTPNGCLICNGAEVSRTTYARLFAAIGTIYGEGDGSTTFNLPNLTDRFIQGSGTAGIDKEAGLPNITGRCNLPLQYGGFSGSLVTNGTTNALQSHGTQVHALGLDASKSSDIYGKSDTVQPPALTMRYYIKF